MILTERYVGNNSKRVLLCSTENETAIFSGLVVKYLVSKDKKYRWMNQVTKIKVKRKSLK